MLDDENVLEKAENGKYQRDHSTEETNDRQEYYKSIFDKFDTNKTGRIDATELTAMLKSDDEVPRKIVENIFKASDKDHSGHIEFEEFQDMINSEDYKNHFGKYLNIYIRYVLPRRRHRGLVETDGLYEDQYTCCPPPIAMILISAFELACFIANESTQTSQYINDGPISKIFIYNPYRRQEIWRFLTYMFVHIGYMHLAVNISIQMMLGFPLEMVHKWWRVLLVYFAGVVAGSLGTSVTDPTTYLAGASGGVYALITAHIATIIMNWNEMAFPAIQLVLFLLITTLDVGTSIYNRYWLDIRDQIGYAAHFAGAMAGLLVGIWILKNFNPTKKEAYIWWIALVVYVLLMGTMLIMNVAWTEHFLK